MPRLTRKGQVTIPKATSGALGIGAGSEVESLVRGSEAVIRKGSITDVIERWPGAWPQPEKQRALTRCWKRSEDQPRDDRLIDTCELPALRGVRHAGTAATSGVS